MLVHDADADRIPITGDRNFLILAICFERSIAIPKDPMGEREHLRFYGSEVFIFGRIDNSSTVERALRTRWAGEQRHQKEYNECGFHEALIMQCFLQGR